IATMTLDDARKILSLPRSLGTAADGEEITAQNGRFGPYMRKGSDSRSLESEEQLFTITLAEAEEIYSKPKQRRGRGQAKPPIAEFGNDPSSGKKVVIKDGRFGPYITDGSTNVTVPRGTAPEQVTEGQAFEMLAEKRAKGTATKAKKKEAMRVGVLDIGSNTIHLLLVDAFPGARPNAYADHKRPLSLVRHLDGDGAITEQGQASLVEFINGAVAFAKANGAA